MACVAETARAKMLVALLFLPASRDYSHYYDHGDCVHGMLHREPWDAWTYISAACKSATEKFVCTNQIRLAEMCDVNATAARRFSRQFKRELLRKMRPIEACKRDAQQLEDAFVEARRERKNAFVEAQQLEDQASQNS